MAISPFSARPGSAETERRRARWVLAIATVGIAATLLAYAISPGVRHAVRHAAHSVKGDVSKVLDRDRGKQAHGKRLHLVQPLHSKSAQARAHDHVHKPAAQTKPAGVAAPAG
jgi:hypothetical protein